MEASSVIEAYERLQRNIWAAGTIFAIGIAFGVLSACLALFGFGVNTPMVASAIVLIIIGGSASAYCFVEKRKTKRKSGMTVDDAYLRISKLESEFAKEQELKREMQKNEPAVYFQGVGLLQRMVGESDAALEKRAEHIRKHGHR